ncbi:MAG: hypothetical protein IJO08_00430 [Clostridia bacterium]|nr:hypothetical protein [Clostridia bacterium]
MQPKFLILKFYSQPLNDLFVQKLFEYPYIKFFCKKINGINCVIIKCKSYYEKILNLSSEQNIYQSYIYLYTCISLIIAEITISKFETKLARQILFSKYNYLNTYEKEKINSILNFVLDINYPSSNSKKLYLYRKDLISSKLLLHFRHHNYLYVDHFIFFKLTDYYLHLENIISKTCARY